MRSGRPEDERAHLEAAVQVHICEALVKHLGTLVAKIEESEKHLAKTTAAMGATLRDTNKSLDAFRAQIAEASAASTRISRALVWWTAVMVVAIVVQAMLLGIQMLRA